MNTDKINNEKKSQALKEAKDRVAKKCAIPLPEFPFETELEKHGIKERECYGWEDLMRHVNKNSPVFDKILDEVILEYASSSSGERQDVSFDKLNEWLDGMIKICKDNPPPPDIKRDGELEVLLKLKNLLPDLFTHQSSRKFSLEDMYNLSAFVTDFIAGRKGDFLTTTPQMVADKFINSLTPSSHPEAKEGETDPEIEAVFNMSEEEIDKKLVEFGHNPKQVEKNADTLIIKLKAMGLFPQFKEGQGREVEFGIWLLRNCIMIHDTFQYCSGVGITELKTPAELYKIFSTQSPKK